MAHRNSQNFIDNSPVIKPATADNIVRLVISEPVPRAGSEAPGNVVYSRFFLLCRATYLNLQNLAANISVATSDTKSRIGHLVVLEQVPGNRFPGLRKCGQFSQFV